MSTLRTDEHGCGGWRAAACLLLALVGTLGAADQVLDPLDVVVFARNQRLWAMQGDGRGQRQLFQSPGTLGRLAACPDGSVVAFESYDTGAQMSTIWFVPVAQGGARQALTKCRLPAWSPDGGRLLVTLLRAPRPSCIGLVSRDGSNLLQVTNPNGAADMYPCWAPDGTRIAFVRTTPGAKLSSDVILRDAAGVETVLCTLQSSVLSLSWSPGPDLLLATRTSADKEALYTLKPEPGLPRQLTDGTEHETGAVWTPDGLGLLYSAGNGLQSRLMVRRLGQPAHTLPGVEPNDSDAVIVPGGAHRAPIVFVGNQRSYYLPCPRAVADDVLLPAPDLARQLHAVPPAPSAPTPATPPTPPLTFDPARVTLVVGDRHVTFNAGSTEVTVDGATQKLTAAPVTVAGVLLIPAAATARLLGLTADYNAEARVLRLGGNEQSHAASGRTEK